MHGGIQKKNGVIRTDFYGRRWVTEECVERYELSDGISPLFCARRQKGGERQSGYRNAVSMRAGNAVSGN